MTHTSLNFMFKPDGCEHLSNGCWGWNNLNMNLDFEFYLERNGPFQLSHKCLKLDFALVNYEKHFLIQIYQKRWNDDCGYIKQEDGINGYISLVIQLDVSLFCIIPLYFIS